MLSLEISLFKLYLPLVGWVGLGWLLGYGLPKRIPNLFGKFLYWVGVPVSVIGFLLGADLSGPIWLAPLVAWAAILLGAGLAYGWMRWQLSLAWRRPTQGSFVLSSMVGNTGYLGYPIVLALVGSQYFAWALFYDMLGTMLGAYGLGVVLASHYGDSTESRWKLLQAMVYNPTLASFLAGLWLHDAALPPLLQTGLKAAAWGCISLSLVLIGMRLSQLTSLRSVKLASVSLGIKMLVVPLVLGSLVTLLGMTGAPRIILVLQMAMPPAFATLVITEAYNLDRELAVTSLALGSLSLLALLPFWLWLFPVGAT